MLWKSHDQSLGTPLATCTLPLVVLYLLTTYLRSEHKARLFCGLINDLDGHLTSCSKESSKTNASPARPRAIAHPSTLGLAPLL